jgi:hypothetical protein
MDFSKKRSSHTKSGVFSRIASFLPSKRQISNVYVNRIRDPAKKVVERASKIVTGAYKLGGKKSLKNRKKKSNKTLKKR